MILIGTAGLPVGPSNQFSNQAQQTSTNSGALGDIRLTTSTSHFEPPLKPGMGEKDFALAIVDDYVTAWVKFTQSGIACYVRAIEENGRKAASIREYHLPSKREFLEKDLPHQFEQM
jgi:hypothetical protein